jgi:hypothetical protein
MNLVTLATIAVFLFSISAFLSTALEAASSQHRMQNVRMPTQKLRMEDVSTGSFPASALKNNSSTFLESMPSPHSNSQPVTCEDLAQV